MYPLTNRQTKIHIIRMYTDMHIFIYAPSMYVYIDAKTNVL